MNWPSITNYDIATRMLSCLQDYDEKSLNRSNDNEGLIQYHHDSRELQNQLWSIRHEQSQQTNDQLASWHAPHDSEASFIATALDNYASFAETGSLLRSWNHNLNKIGYGEEGVVYANERHAFKLYHQRRAVGTMQSLQNFLFELDKLFKLQGLRNTLELQACSLQDNCIVDNFVNGDPLTKMTLEQIVENEEHFKAFLNLISDAVARGVSPDFAKLDNVRYNPETGFHILDFRERLKQSQILCRPVSDLRELVNNLSCRKLINLIQFTKARLQTTRTKDQAGAIAEYKALCKLLNLVLDHIEERHEEAWTIMSHETFGESFNLELYDQFVAKSGDSELQELVQSLKNRAPYLFTASSL